ncbi:hypothetical protein DXT74_16235 [Chromobacterium sp. Rain0013]|nr:hypothetical protein DXT74_16235 [Chromobacterium sp. Rain0013]
MQRAGDDGAFQFRVQFDLQFPHGAGGADDASEHRRIRPPLLIQGQAFAVDVVAGAGVVLWAALSSRTSSLSIVACRPVFRVNPQL